MLDVVINVFLILLLVNFTIRSIFKTLNVISDFSNKKMERNFKRYGK